jgi:hypothetical protein
MNLLIRYSGMETAVSKFGSWQRVEDGGFPRYSLSRARPLSLGPSVPPLIPLFFLYLSLFLFPFLIPLVVALAHTLPAYDIPFPPRRTGIYRKGMISARRDRGSGDRLGIPKPSCASALGRRHVPRGAPSLWSG